MMKQCDWCHKEHTNEDKVLHWNFLRSSGKLPYSACSKECENNIGRRVETQQRARKVECNG